MMVSTSGSLQVSFRIRKDLDAKVRGLAESEGVSMTEIYNRAIEFYLSEHNPLGFTATAYKSGRTSVAISIPAHNARILGIEPGDKLTVLLGKL